MGSDPEAADNRWLREAMESQIPIIYFLGIAPGRYTAIYPTFIAGWSKDDLVAKLAFGMPLASSVAALPSAPERRYALRLVSQRLHQATFREAVLTAYDGRCAISRLPERRLLDAAHIIADGDEELGQPMVANELPLSKVHHAAFDANLIGIDADYRIHVSEQLFAMNDGPMLEQGIKAMRGKSFMMPSRTIDWPDRGGWLPASNNFKQRTDPSHEEKVARAKSRVEENDTFKTVAKEWIAKNEREDMAEITLSKIRWLLEMAYSGFSLPSRRRR